MITDEMVSIAAEEANKVLIDSLPEADKCNHEFTHGFERKMKKIIKRARHPVMYRFLQSAAGFLLILFLGISTVLAVNVEARERLFGWIKEQYETLFSYYFSGESQNGEPPGAFQIELLPDGYEEIARQELAESTSVIYDDGSGEYLQFSYAGAFENTAMFIVNQNCEKSIVMVGEYEADLYIYDNADESNAIVWIDESRNVIFYIAGYFDGNELIRLAESVAEQK